MKVKTLYTCEFCEYASTIISIQRTSISIDEIFTLIELNRPKHTFNTPRGAFSVKLGSARLRTFKANVSCIWCGVSGAYFQLDTSHDGSGMPRGALNMYTASAQLMTVDHCIPKSKLKSFPSLLRSHEHPELTRETAEMNLATMCATCNTEKGFLLPLNFVLRMTDWPETRCYRNNGSGRYSYHGSRKTET